MLYPLRKYAILFPYKKTESRKKIMQNNKKNPLKSLIIINSIFVTLLIYGLTLYTIAAAIYYGLQEANGISSNGMFLKALVFSGILIGIIILSKLMDIFINRLIRKEHQWQPDAADAASQIQTDLESVLHKIAQKTGVIVWDSLWGIVAGFFGLIMLVQLAFNPVTITIFAVSVAALAAGHVIGTLIWRKHSLAPKLLKNSAPYCNIVDEAWFVEHLDKDIREHLLYYSKELVLTEQWILAPASLLINLPVAIPVEQIENISFRYEERYVRHGYISTGYLTCRLKYGNSIEFITGEGDKATRIPKILSKYGFDVSEAQS